MSGELTHDKVKLRPLEPADLEWLYECENDPSIWHLSNTRLPYSKHLLKQYIDHAQESIYVHGQIRFVIALHDDTAIGMLDFFDFDPFHQRAGIGIMICAKYRGNGFASEALSLAKKYAFDFLNLNQMYCNIAENNKSSINLFTTAGFTCCGRKKDWLKTRDGFEDEYIFQLLKG